MTPNAVAPRRCATETDSGSSGGRMRCPSLLVACLGLACGPRPHLPAEPSCPHRVAGRPLCPHGNPRQRAHLVHRRKPLPRRAGGLASWCGRARCSSVPISGRSPLRRTHGLQRHPRLSRKRRHRLSRVCGRELRIPPQCLHVLRRDRVHLQVRSTSVAHSHLGARQLGRRHPLRRRRGGASAAWSSRSAPTAVGTRAWEPSARCSTLAPPTGITTSSAPRPASRP